MTTRVFSIILAVITAVSLQASCGKVNKEESTETGASTVQKSDDPIVAEIDDYLAKLSNEHNFDGRTFTWIGSGGEAPTDEEETGSVENDAFYYRQRDLEGLFGIDWINYTSQAVDDSGIHPTIDNVLRDVMAGTNS